MKKWSITGSKWLTKKQRQESRLINFWRGAAGVSLMTSTARPLLTFDELFERAFHIVFTEKLPNEWYTLNQEDFKRDILKVNYLVKMKTDKSYLIDVLKERYEYEQFRRNNYDNLINLPITILALLIGGLAAIITQGEFRNDIIRYGVLVGMLPVGISIYYLVRVFYGVNRNYDVLPQAKDINDHFEKLSQYHAELNEPSENIHSSFQEDLIKWYSECSKANCAINDKRMDYFHKSKMWLIISIVIIFIFLFSKIIFDL